MHKLSKLREHLLASALSLDAEKLHTFAHKGKVKSYPGAGSHNFEWQYPAQIIIDDFAGNPDHVVFIILQWLKRNQPNTGECPISFDADLLDDNRSDFALYIELSEVIAVTESDQGYSLNMMQEPYLECDEPLTLDIVFDPNGPPDGILSI